MPTPRTSPAALRCVPAGCGLEAFGRRLRGRTQHDLLLSQRLEGGAGADGSVDVLLVDAPSPLSALGLNALVAARLCYALVGCDARGLEAAQGLVGLAALLREARGTDARLRLVPCLPEDERSGAERWLDTLRRRVGASLSPVVLPFDERLDEASALETPLPLLFPEAPSALACHALSVEVAFWAEAARTPALPSSEALRSIAA
ncbi:MAG: ParA family protein [Planctomycetota bacterium]|nr:MAG: ParA family protein [Planctomycetota bacterium]